jgi:multisubunit Na+/H+ antiporter MnhB subunit
MAIVTKSEPYKSTLAEKRQGHSRRLRDFFLYIAIGMSVAILASLLGVYQAKTGQKPDALLKWIGFTIMSLLVFRWTIRAYRPQWGRARFWTLLAIFAVIHAGLGVGLLLRTKTGSLFPFVVIIPLEYFLLSTYLSRFLTQKE